MKTCRQCGLEKHEAEFYKRGAGLRAECKSCYGASRSNYYKANKDTVDGRNKRYYEKNKESICLYKSAWQKENSEKRRLRLNERYKTEPNFRIAVLLRTRMLNALRNAQKFGAALDILGCSVEYFKEYIASKFKGNMTWENRGKVWHLDHIKPCAKFNLSDESQQRICFHYTNMQPLFVAENLVKGDR